LSPAAWIAARRSAARLNALSRLIDLYNMLTLIDLAAQRILANEAKTMFGPPAVHTWTRRTAWLPSATRENVFCLAVTPLVLPNQAVGSLSAVSVSASGHTRLGERRSDRHIRRTNVNYRAEQHERRRR
jgi:hypothetical protein